MNELDLNARGRALNPFGELALEAPSSVSSRKRFLRAGMAGIMLAMEKGEDMETVKCDNYCGNEGASYAWISSLSITKPFILVKKGFVEEQTSYYPIIFYSNSTNICAVRLQNYEFSNTRLSETGTSAAWRIAAGTEFYVVKP